MPLSPITDEHATPPGERSGARALTLVATAAEESAQWFCGYCGEPAAGDPPTPLSRVCDACAGGLMLEAPADAAPRPGDAFLVVDCRLTVQAVSRGAEKLLEIQEQDVIDLPLSELLTDADSELDGPHSFATAVTETALRDETGWSAFIRPAAAFGIRMRARITHCGPPRAALIVLEPGRSRAPRLRLVQAERPQARAGGA